MNEQLDNRVEGIITGLKKQRPRNHPILEHPVSKVEEYVQKLYIDALCVAAQYANENADEGLAFVERIHSGIGLNDEFPEHIKNAMNITPEKFEEFFIQCKENALENILVLDCLLIAGADGVPNSKQISFAVEIAEALGMTKENISLMSELAVVILEQDNDKYREVCEKIPADDVMNIVGIAICYVKEFVSGVLLDTPDILWINSKKRFDLDKETYYSIDNYKDVIVENADVYFDISVSTCGNVMFRNCIGTCRMICSKISNLTLEKCKFDLSNYSETTTYLFHLSDVNNFNVLGCEISNVPLYGYSQYHVFNVNNNNSCELFKIENTSFFNINSPSKYLLFVYMSYASIVVKDCKFTTCSGRYLFPKSKTLTFENNTYENCCEVLG